jgi:hypothetical protein
MARAAASLPLLGWKEIVGFPAWGLTLKALIDPASPLSTLAVEQVSPLRSMRDAAGKRRLVLRLAVPMARGRGRLKIVHAFYHRRTRLGEDLGRCYVVRVPVCLGRWEWEAELALLLGAARRQHFLHLGRADLAGRFRLDPALSYLHAPARHRFEPEPSLPLPAVRDRDA